MADAIKTDETLPDVPAKDVKEAQLQGVKAAIAESAEQRFKSTDGVAVTEPVSTAIVPTYDVFHLQDMLTMAPDALAKALKGDSGPSITQGQVAALVEVERSGKNRTDIVKVLCDYLGIKSPYEVTDAGPNYTNPVNRDVLERV